MAEAQKIRILLADDRKIVSDAFRLILENAGFEVIAVAATGREAVDKTLELRPDVVLLDVAMPEMDGFAALAIIKYAHPDAIPIILTSHTDDVYVARAAELGAAGFFSKQVDPQLLIDAIRASAEAGAASDSGDQLEGKLRSPSMLGAGFHAAVAGPSLELSDQESRVLSLLANGGSSEQIREDLVISANTLKTHLRNIYMKIGASNRTEAALWALRHGYGEEDEDEA